MLSLSPQFSARLAEHSRQLAGVQNEYSFALVSASAHLQHYQRVELPAAMQVRSARPQAVTGSIPRCHCLVAALGGQGCSSGGMWQCWGVPTRCPPGTGRGSLRAAPGALDGRQPDGGGDLPGLPGLVPGRCGGVCTGNSTGPAAGGHRRARVSPQPHALPLLQVCREQDLLLFLQDHPAFSLAPEQRFQLSGLQEVRGWGGGFTARRALHSHPLPPPCPCPGVPAATSRRRGQPGEGGTALGHACGPGPQEQGTRRGGGCCAAPRGTGGSGRAFPSPSPAGGALPGAAAAGGQAAAGARG